MRTIALRATMLALLLCLCASARATGPAAWQEKVRRIQDRYGVQVEFDQFVFSPSWRSWQPTHEVIPEGERLEALEELGIDLSYYEEEFIRKNLRRVFLYSELNLLDSDGVRMGCGGSSDYERRWLYVSPRSLGRRGRYRWATGFHHELAGILYNRYLFKFPVKRWVAENPPGFAYLFVKNSPTHHREERGELVGNEEFYSKGFNCHYACLSMEADISTFAQMMIRSPLLLERRAERAPAMRNKPAILAEFYDAIGCMITSPKDFCRPAALEPRYVMKIARLRDSLHVQVHYRYSPEEFLAARMSQREDPLLCTQADLDDMARVIPLVRRFLETFPPSVLRVSLPDLYLVGELFDSRGTYASTNESLRLYIATDNRNDEELLRRMYSAFSDILRDNFDFPESEWMNLVPAGFQFVEDRENAGPIEDPYSQDPALLAQGFLLKYSQRSMGQDFDMISGWLFAKPDDLKSLMWEHEVLRKKVKLAIRFYESISPEIRIPEQLRAE